MNYRNAIASDLPELLRLCKESANFESDKQYRQIVHAQLVLIAQVGSMIVGLAMLHDNQADLLYVHRNFEKHDIAEDLLSKLVYIAQSYTTTKAANGIRSGRPFLCANQKTIILTKP